MSRADDLRIVLTALEVSLGCAELIRPDVLLALALLDTDTYTLRGCGGPHRAGALWTCSPKRGATVSLPRHSDTDVRLQQRSARLVCVAPPCAMCESHLRGAPRIRYTSGAA
jgi:hypothetical protein